VGFPGEPYLFPAALARFPGMAAARKTGEIEDLPPPLPAEVERAVRAAGALPLARLTRVKLGERARRELERQLVVSGLERTAKLVRVPLGEQLLTLVRGGGRVALKDLAKRVKGGAKKEIDAAIDRLIRAGQARVVVRTQIEVLVGAGDRALDPAEVAELVKAHAALGKVLKKVTAKGRARSVLLDDLAPLVAPLHASSAPAAPPPTAPAGAAIVAEALRRLEHPVLKLARVPELVRALDGRVAMADVHRALLDADDAGEIELRPEAGGEYLSPEEARLCPPGPRGTVLSYARIVRP
jgi:hypothetical protein